MTLKKEKSDTQEVEFVAEKRSDGKFYSLTVICAEELTDEEYADCLVAFAKDIYDGEFKFANDSGSPEVFSQ